MSASQIPNLLDSLGGPRTARARRRKPEGDDADRIVQQTDNDAAGSRLSAVELGFLVDRYASKMARSSTSSRRIPIINRGTYVRTSAIDVLLEKFIARHSSASTVQIISLGAGTDTRYFRFIEKNSSWKHKLRYHELDFASATATKIRAITSAQELSDLISPCKISEDKTSLSSMGYLLHPMDLRSLVSMTTPDSLSIHPTAPTLVLSECCLTYIPPETSTSILDHITKVFLPSPGILEIVLYEPLHPTDSFGRTMVQNLGARGIQMPGLDAFPTINTHLSRLKEKGFSGEAGGLEVREWWNERVNDDEKERLRGLEMVDEEEEWNLLAAHYGLIWASRQT